jgi:hypothetical protein
MEAVATTTLVPRALNALSRLALPMLTLIPGGVGIKGGSTEVTAAVAPEVGVGTSNGESGSPVDAAPVGDAVTGMLSSSMLYASQLVRKAVCDSTPTRRVRQHSTAEMK